MKFYVAGDKSQAICSHCEGLVNTTFVRRDVRFSDDRGLAKDILAAVCDTCDAVVGVPSQSTPAIKAAREAAEVSVEARLPASYIDRLDQSMHCITSSAATKHRKMFISLYIDYLSRKQSVLEQAIIKWHEPEGSKKENSCTAEQVGSAYFLCAGISPSKEKEKSKRLSLKLNVHIANELVDLRTQAQLSQTEFLKFVIREIQDEVVFKKNKELIEQFTILARVAM